MMEAIKKYFSGWDTARIIKIVLGAAFAAGYFSTKENIYLVGAVFLSFQAIFNISCPGGSCSTSVPKKNDKQVMEFEQYKPDKNKTNV